MEVNCGYSMVEPWSYSYDVEPIEIVFNVGAPHIASQEFKTSERSGFFTYKESADATSVCSNRHIHWRYLGDMVEFFEVSLDRNLIRNRLQLRFVNSPVLQRVKIHESASELIILIPTASSVYRLILKHPRKHLDVTSQFKNLKISGSQQQPSVFSDLCQENFSDYCFAFILSDYYANASTTSMHHPTAACCFQTNADESIFALSNSDDGIYMIRVSSKLSGNHVSTFDLRQVTIIDRLWRGLVPNIIRGQTENENAVLRMEGYEYRNDQLLIALSKNAQIRVWSLGRKECISTYNLLESLDDLLSQDTTDAAHSTPSKRQTAIQLQSPYLRKCCTEDPNSFLLATLVKSASEKQFVVLRFHKESASFSLICKLNTINQDLIDFFITPNSLWTLWVNSEGQINMMFASLAEDTRQIWQTIPTCEQLLSTVNFKSTFLNVRELFLDALFENGKFSMANIARALSIFNRSQDSEEKLGATQLMEQAITSVEGKMRKSIEGDLSSSDYVKAEHFHWQQLHDFCLQYRNVSTAPLGLVYDPRTNFVALIQKQDWILVCSNDYVDDLILNEHSDQANFLDQFMSDRTAEQSFLKVLEAVRTIGSCLTEDAILSFEMALYNGDSIDKITDDLLENYLLVYSHQSGEVPLKQIFVNFFIEAPQFLSMIKLIINLMDLSSDLYDDPSAATQPDVSASLAQFFSSNSGVQLLARNFHQLSRTRLCFLRDFVLLQKFLLNLQGSKDVEMENVLRCQTIPLSEYYIQIYYTLVWSCETFAQLDHGQTLADESRINVLNLLKLSRHSKLCTRLDPNDQNQCLAQPLIVYFLQNKGISLAKQVFAPKFNSNGPETCSETLSGLVKSIARVIWPLSSMHFAEFLLGAGLYDQLIDYVNQLNTLKLDNEYTLQFFRAIAHFQLGEHKVALNSFLGMFECIWKEPFIYQALGINIPDDENGLITSEHVYLFFRKLMQFFDENAPLECKIKLCNEALSYLQFYTDGEYERYVCSFLSTLFRAELELENYEAAYNAITLNQSAEQRKSCLREFILHLYEQGYIDQLITYSYNQLEDEFITILESKARSSDVSLNVKSNSISYYEVLYKYFGCKNNFRRAATAMYEFYLRLSQEVPGHESLQRQARCISMALNCLHIVKPEYAWIIKPALKLLPSVKHSQANESLKEMSFRMSISKRDSEGENISYTEAKASLSEAIKHKIEILGIEQIKGEYELTRARIKILDKDSKANSIGNSYLQVSELVTMLCENAMYDNAFFLAQYFKLSLESIFEGLVSKYIYFVQNPIALERDFKSIQDWFVENETASLSHINYSKSSVLNKMWLLIAKYIEKFEQKNQSFIHKCVSEKLLSSGIILPSSLRLSYQKRNSSELLLLLMSYNYIEEAVNLAIELINGYLGTGTEYFDITQVMPNVVVYFPHQHFRCLLKILDIEKDENEHYETLHTLLSEKIEIYQNMSADMAKLA